MNRNDAAAIAAHLETAISHLSLALGEAHARLDPVSLENLKHSIGSQIGRLSFEVLDPIYAEHPDLAPPGVLEQ
jgi:hypothetical protein